MDETEPIRRSMVAKINSQQADRASLEEQHGRIWDTQELSLDFEVVGFLAPFVVVRRKTDDVKGTLVFQHHPRYYWGFTEAA